MSAKCPVATKCAATNGLAIRNQRSTDEVGYSAHCRAALL